jgi:type IV pilus assembly protein PilA
VYLHDLTPAFIAPALLGEPAALKSKPLITERILKKEGISQMMKFMNKKRKVLGNKGFSLVELIIVIAIMAVLVAVLAPQLLKYVEKSRVAADNTFADTLLNTVKVVLSDDSNATTINEDFTVTWTDGAVAVGGNDSAAVVTALTNLLPGYANKAIQSNEYKAAAKDTYVITVSFATNVGVATAAWGAGAAG